MFRRFFRCHIAAVAAVFVTVIAMPLATAQQPTGVPTSTQKPDEKCAPLAETVKPGSGIVNPKLKSEKAPRTPDRTPTPFQGTVELEATVMPDGSICGVTVTKSLDASPRSFDEEAIKAARQWKFEPGMRDGKPVPVRVGIEMTFTKRMGAAAEAFASLANAVTIRGNVREPGTMMLVVPGLTAGDLLNQAGGREENTEPSQPAFRIERRDPATGRNITLRAEASTIVRPGDVVMVEHTKA